MQARSIGTSVLDEETNKLIALLAPNYVETFSNFSNIEKLAPTLGVKYGSLLALAANLACTQLDVERSRHLMRLALSNGVTREEIIEMAQVLCCTAAHAFSLAVRVVTTKLDPDGTRRTEENNRDPKRVKVREDFKKRRGYWSTNWEAMLWCDPDYLEVYTDLSSAPWEGNAIPPKIKELIFVVSNVLPSHQHEGGAAVHAELALQKGATVKEIMEAAEIASTVGANVVGLTVQHLADILDLRVLSHNGGEA